MKIRSLAHSTYEHQYHIVWGTKYRRKFLKEYVKIEFLRVLYNTIKKYPTLEVVAVNVDNDHVHLQIEIPPNIAVSKVVQVIKNYSSKHLRSKFKFIDKMYLDSGIWSVGYFSSTIGLNEEKIQKYIAWQGKKELPHEEAQLKFELK